MLWINQLSSAFCFQISLTSIYILQDMMTACYEKKRDKSCHPSKHARYQLCNALAQLNVCVNVLHAAALGRQAAVVSYLVNDLNVDPNSMADNRTALHWVYDSEHVYW